MPHTIDRARCTGVGDCLLVCPTAAIAWVEAEALPRRACIRPERCIDCGACLKVCPVPGTVLAEWHPDLQAMPPGIPCIDCAAVVEDTARFCPSCRAPVASRVALGDLALLDAPALAVLLGQVGARPLAAILRSAGEPLGSAVAARLGAREADALRAASAALGSPATPADLADARERTVIALRRLVATRGIRYRGPT